MSAVETRTEFKLKYGCNPHQKEASVRAPEGKTLPFKVLSGSDAPTDDKARVGDPGYINLLDALNAWQLVSELRKSLGEPAAASFKHVSPAGAAIAVPLTDELREVYDIKKDQELSPILTAYIRARQADPKSSFGDFAALSDRVDVPTAKYLKECVSDGIIAPAYDPEALEILKQKKKGRYIILEADPNYEPPKTEYREVFGAVLSQTRNTELITVENSFQDHQVVTNHKEPSELKENEHPGNPVLKEKDSEEANEARRDLIVAAIAVKYTQSNSVAFALDGQVIGIGAGQQSRVDCVRLAGNKALTWQLRHLDHVKSLKFKSSVKKTGRLNARLQYIEGQFTDPEHKAWSENFEEVPEPLTQKEKSDFLKGFFDNRKGSSLKGVSLASDAFFPFRDNIDQAQRFGVKYILQPGGSQRDSEVTEACNVYKISMAHNSIRLFHH